MNDTHYHHRVRRGLVVSAMLHALMFAYWPMWAVESELPEPEPPPLHVQLVELEPEPEPQPEDVQQASPDEPTKAEPPPEPESEPEWIRFVSADVPSPEEPAELVPSHPDVISAVSENEPEQQGLIAAAEAGELSLADAPASAAATASVAVPLSSQALEQVAGAPETAPSTAGAERDWKALVDAELSLAADRSVQVEAEPGADLLPVEGSTDTLDPFETELDPLPEPPSLASAGALASDGGERRSTQSVIEGAAKAAHSTTRRANTPLGRYTNRVYEVLRRRWHRHEVQVMPIEREVTVRFQIARVGTISNTTVVHSSGDPMLDAMARASVPKRLAPFPAALGQKSIDQQITFRYQP